MATVVEGLNNVLGEGQGFTTKFTGDRDERVGFQTAFVTEGFDHFPRMNVCGDTSLHVGTNPPLRNSGHYLTSLLQHTPQPSTAQVPAGARPAPDPCRNLALPVVTAARHA